MSCAKTHNLPTQAKKLPLSSGVYFFIGAKNEILYIGRATSLRKRVLNYFQKNQGERIAEMIGLAKRIKFSVTDSVLEAIILEANLIKKHWPKYNVKDKDDRSFIYIVIPKKVYTRPLIVRGKDLDKFTATPAHIFGPYQSLSLVREALKIVRRIFPYGHCVPLSGSSSKSESKPCFDHQIGLCPGACIGRISPRDYQKNINQIILFLRGDKKRLLKQLLQDEPEKARSLRHIQDVSLIQNSELGAINHFSRIEAYDISHLSGQEVYGSMAVFIDGEATKSEYRLFKLTIDKNDDLAALREILERRFNHSEWLKPDLILIDGGRPQVRSTSDLLVNRHINIPIIGISKLAGDQLVFSSKIGRGLRTLIESSKSVLLEARDEAHRFALRASRKDRIKKWF